MSTVSIRYVVNDVPAAVDFYTEHLGFEVRMQPNDSFAMLSRGDLRLVLVSGAEGGCPEVERDAALTAPSRLQ